MPLRYPFSKLGGFIGRHNCHHRFCSNPLVWKTFTKWLKVHSQKCAAIITLTSHERHDIVHQRQLDFRLKANEISTQCIAVCPFAWRVHLWQGFLTKRTSHAECDSTSWSFHVRNYLDDEVGHKFPSFGLSIGYYLLYTIFFQWKTLANIPSGTVC